MTAEPPRRLRILLVDDEDMVRHALRALIETVFDDDVIDARSVSEATSLIKAERFDVALLDVRMPEMDGIDGLRHLRREAPGLPIIMLSSYDDVKDVRDAVEEGARGYIIKGATTQQLREAIEIAVYGEGTYLHPVVAGHLIPTRREGKPALEALSERELVVLTCVCDGATNAEIANMLSVSAKTVKSQLSSVFRKLGVANRTEAVAFALRGGLVGERGTQVRPPGPNLG